MPEDASLDDFLPGGDGDGGESGESPDGDGESTEAQAGTAGPGLTEQAADDERGEDETVGEEAGPGADQESGAGDGSAVNRPSATSRWVPGGATCPACGRSVSRLWRGGDGLVCADCKAWEDG